MDVRDTLETLSRTIRWHRRGLAAVAAAICVMASLAVLVPAPPPTRSVLVAARDLTGGLELRDADVVLRDVPESALPADALTDPTAVDGGVLAVGRGEGTVITTADVVGSSLTTSADEVLVPVSLDGLSGAEVLRVGDTVQVLGADALGEVTVVGTTARVVSLPASTSDGLMSSSTAGSAILAVRSTEGLAVASAAARGPLGVIIQGR